MLYSVIVSILRFIFYFLGLKVEGLNNLPAKGPVILAANHVSNWDPVVVAVAVPRPINFIAKAELFKFALLGKLLTRFNAFPVKRGTPDRQAIRHALKVLENGNVLGIFPEGRRKMKGIDTKVQSGIALLALKSRAPVVPVACLGTNHTIPLGWFRPLKIVIGKPINLKEYHQEKISSELLSRISNNIMQEINCLLTK